MPSPDSLKNSSELVDGVYALANAGSRLMTQFAFPNQPAFGMREYETVVGAVRSLRDIAVKNGVDAMGLSDEAVDSLASILQARKPEDVRAAALLTEEKINRLRAAIVGKITDDLERSMEEKASPDAKIPILLVMPGSDAEAMHAYAPAGLSEDEARKIANWLISAANAEDAVNTEGGCDDGLVVQESIRRRLVEAGFVLPTTVETIAWDGGEAEPEVPSP